MENLVRLDLFFIPTRELWEKTHADFHAHTRAKARKLCTELQSTTLGDKFVSNYLLRNKSINDSLFFAGNPISSNDQLEATFEGLPRV